MPIRSLCNDQYDINSGHNNYDQTVVTVMTTSNCSILKGWSLQQWPPGHKCYARLAITVMTTPSVILQQRHDDHINEEQKKVGHHELETFKTHLIFSIRGKSPHNLIKLHIVRGHPRQHARNGVLVICGEFGGYGRDALICPNQ